MQTILQFLIRASFESAPKFAQAYVYNKERHNVHPTPIHSTSIYRGSEVASDFNTTFNPGHRPYQQYNGESVTKTKVFSAFSGRRCPKF